VRARRRHRREVASAHHCGLALASCGNEDRHVGLECTHSLGSYSDTARKRHSGEFSGSRSRPGVSRFNKRGRLQLHTAWRRHTGSEQPGCGHGQPAITGGQQVIRRVDSKQASSPTRAIRSAPERCRSEPGRESHKAIQDAHEGSHSPGMGAREK
jgi:hypothetical protein